MAVASMIGSASLAATSIIVVRRATEILIAADSKRAGHNLPDTSVCKISVGRIAIAAAGVTEGPDFDLHGLAQRVVHRSGRVTDLVSAFDAITWEPVFTLAGLLSLEPDFESKYVDTARLLQVIFAGFDGDVAVVIEHFHEPSIGRNRQLEIIKTTNVCPPRCGGPSTARVFGESAAIKRELSTDSTADLPSRLYAAIQAQIRETPETVGPPINVLRMTSTGSRWVLGGDNCQ